MSLRSKSYFLTFVMSHNFDIFHKNIAHPTVLVIALIGALLFGSSQTAASTNLPFQLILLESGDATSHPAQPSNEAEATPRIWLILLPFQNAPGPNTHGPDPKTMKPFYEQEPRQQGEAHKTGIRFDRCLDANLCLLKVINEQHNQEREVMVRLFGIDTPSLQGTCDQETVLATAAVELLGKVLSEAAQIDLYDHYMLGRVHMSRVVADGQDLSQLLINQGLAASYGDGRKDWCND